jgi:hypothetical protein
MHPRPAQTPPVPGQPGMFQHPQQPGMPPHQPVRPHPMPGQNPPNQGYLGQQATDMMANMHLNEPLFQASIFFITFHFCDRTDDPFFLTTVDRIYTYNDEKYPRKQPSEK